MSGKSLCIDNMISESFQWNDALYLAHGRLNHGKMFTAIPQAMRN